MIRFRTALVVAIGASLMTAAGAQAMPFRSVGALEPGTLTCTHNGVFANPTGRPSCGHDMGVAKSGDETPGTNDTPTPGTTGDPNPPTSTGTQSDQTDQGDQGDSGSDQGDQNDQGDQSGSGSDQSGSGSDQGSQSSQGDQSGSGSDQSNQND